jgi:hypothetical protein
MRRDGRSSKHARHRAPGLDARRLVVFLDHPDDVERTIPYIEGNPDAIRLPCQRWPFVKRYDRWPLHEGYSVNSPYAQRLRAVGRYP